MRQKKAHLQHVDRVDRADLMFLFKPSISEGTHFRSAMTLWRHIGISGYTLIITLFSFWVSIATTVVDHTLCRTLSVFENVETCKTMYASSTSSGHADVWGAGMS